MPDGQTATDTRIADLRQAGKIRVALYPPQYAKDDSGELRGWTIELARALAERIGVEFVPVEYPTPPKAMEALKTGVCDVGFGAMNASRNSEIDFSPAVLQFDFTYLVPSASRIHNISDADLPGVRIAAVLNHASTLCLSRIRKMLSSSPQTRQKPLLSYSGPDVRMHGHQPAPL